MNGSDNAHVGIVLSVLWSVAESVEQIMVDGCMWEIGDRKERRSAVRVGWSQGL